MAGMSLHGEDVNYGMGKPVSGWTLTKQQGNTVEPMEEEEIDELLEECVYCILPGTWNSKDVPSGKTDHLQQNRNINNMSKRFL